MGTAVKNKKDYMDQLVTDHIIPAKKVPRAKKYGLFKRLMKIFKKVKPEPGILKETLESTFWK